MKTTKTEVTADIVVEKSAKREILLIRRKNEPFKGDWALPGGFIDTEEEAVTAAARELKEETGIESNRSELEFIDYFDAPDRDPRGRVISFAFGLKVDDEREANAADDAEEAQWFAIDEIPELAFDHRTIIARWKER